jgi:hypothetical protein
LISLSLSLLESDGDKERVVETIEMAKEEEEAEDEDDAISRLGLMEQELLQEQEETKSEVLGENNTDSYINDMIERKLTERFDRMETEWELKMNQVTEEAATISRKAERVWQMERSVSTQAEEVFKVIREATTPSILWR